MASNKLIVEIVGDDRQLSRAFGHARGEADKFNHSMVQTIRGTLAGSGAFSALGRQIAFASGTFLGAAGFAAVATKSVSIASNLAEQQNKVAVVFGRSGQAVQQWAKTTAVSIGIANDQALEAAGVFGNLFRTVGLLPAQNAKLSRSLVKLAADMASFNNADPSEVLDAIRSGLIGEAEPLRRFGVLLSETRVQQEAMRETGKKTAANLTAQEKLLARYNLILRDTAPAQGDFARTQDGLANASRQLSAEIRDTEAVLGKALLPTVRKITLALRDWLAKPENQKRLQKDTEETVHGLARFAHGVGVAAHGTAVFLHYVDKVGDALDAAIAKARHAGFAYSNLADALHQVGTEQRRLIGLANQTPATGEDVAARGAGARTGGVSLGGATGGPVRLSLQGQLNRLELELSKALTTISKADDRAILMQEKQLLRRLIASTKDWQKRRQLYDQLAQVQRNIEQLDQDATRKKQEAQQKELERRQQELSKIRAQESALKSKIEAIRSQFKAAVDAAREGIGALFAGPVLQPTDEARKHLLGVGAPLSSDPKAVVRDLKAQNQQFAAFQRDINRILKAAKGSLTKAQIKELRTELEAGGVGTAGTLRGLVAGGKPALNAFFKQFGAREKLALNTAKTEMHSQLVNLHAIRVRLHNVQLREEIVIHNIVTLDGKKVAENTTKHQTRRERNNSASRRGRNAGRH